MTRSLPSWFICNILKEHGRVYADLMIERSRKIDNIRGRRTDRYTDLLESGTLQSIVKRIERELTSKEK